jgi:hypothetical protein
MGIFGNRAPASAWYVDATGVVPDGVQGGDIQIGDSWGLRLRRDDKPGSIIDITYWAFADPENRGEFGVTRQVEWLVCEDPEDPWGTEIWSDSEQSDVNDLVMRRAEAIAEARKFAEEDLAGAAELYGDWDGDLQ